MRVKHYSEVKFVNVRPDNYNTHDFNKGDCTTRALAYTASQIGVPMNYVKIENEQYRLARERGTRRNTTGTWDLIAKNWGYHWIQLEKPKARTIVTAMLRGISTPVMTLSRGHISIAHNGKIVDTWDSSGGRVFALMVKDIDCDNVRVALNEKQIGCECVARPTLPKNYRKW